MIINRVLAAFQHMQLHGDGHKEVKVFVEGNWYTVQAVTAGPDNAVLTLKKD